MFRAAHVLILVFTLPFVVAPAANANEKAFEVRSLEDYGNGRDSIEVNYKGTQHKLKIDVNNYPRFFRKDGTEIRNPRHENALVKGNKHIFITFEGNRFGGRILKIRHAD